MATLVSELVRVLSDAAARELKARSEGPPLTRAEMVALATLNELAAAFLAVRVAPAQLSSHDDWDFMAALAARDASAIASGKAKRAAAT